MKRILGITLLIVVLLTGMVFATYEENNNVELINIPDDVGNEITNPNARNIDDVELINFPDDIENEVTNSNAREDYDSEIIEDDVYRMDSEVVVNEMVDANVYAMGKDVKIDGATINGNLYVIGQNVKIVNSEVTGSIYVIGENVGFTGIANDFYALGEKIDLRGNSTIWRNAKIAGNELIIDGVVGRDLLTTVEELSVGKTAVINGTLKYNSESEANIPDNAKIGKVEFSKVQINEDEGDVKTYSIKSYLYDIVSIAFKTLVVALIIIFLVNKFDKIDKRENTVKDLLKKAVVGFGYLVIIPVVSILLMISVIGFGFGMIALILYIIALYVATSVTSFVIAQRILDKNQEMKKASLIGLSILVSIIIWVIKFIPVVGGIIEFVIVLSGIGIIFSSMFKRTKKEEVINEK